MSNTVLYGRVTRDIECRYSQQGTAIARFSIAVNRKYQQGNKSADFFNIISFGKRAETISQYFHQGSRIVVYCHPQQEQYERKDGTKVDTVIFILEDFDFVDTMAEGGIARNHSGQSSSSLLYNKQDDFLNIPNGISEGLPFD